MGSRSELRLRMASVSSDERLQGGTVNKSFNVPRMIGADLNILHLKMLALR